MARFQFRRSLRFENLEARQLMSSGGPTDQEQYMLQLINQARTNPAAAAAQITSPSNLTPDVQATLNYYNVNIAAGRAHDRHGHASASAGLERRTWRTPHWARASTRPKPRFRHIPAAAGRRPQQRIEAAGYTDPTSTAENTYAYGSSVMESMQAFLMDWGVPSDGHRINIQQPGVPAQNAFTSVGHRARANQRQQSFVRPDGHYARFC